MPSAPKVSEGTVVDFTIDALRDAIRSGRLVPGQRLIVADITAMLSVSAGPVREAIRRLTGEGLIEIVPHRGASVRQITPRDLQEIYQLRSAVEGLGARLAAGQVDAFRGELDALVADMDHRAAAEDREAYLACNTAFHDLIARMSGNERVRTLATQLSLPIYQLRLPHLMSVEALHQSHREHRVIAAALASADGDAAEAAMRRHIANAGVGLAETLAAIAPPVRPPRERTPLG